MSNKKILVVEDENCIREIIRNCLKSESYEVIEAENALDAMGIFDFLKEEIGLILTDHNMAHMTGLEFIKNIRSIFEPPYNEVPVIMMSGKSLEEEAKIAGADAYLRKPFELSRLIETIRGYF